MKTTCVRVSTFEQNISRQLEGKEGAVYWDKVSGMVAFEDREDAARLLADAEAEGKYNGRANGTGLSDVDLVEKHSDIVGKLNKGETIRRTAKLTGKSKSTVQRVKKALDRIAYT